MSKYSFQTQTQTKFIQQKQIQVPYQVYITFMNIQINISPWHINYYKHIGRPPLRSYLTVDMEATRKGKASQWLCHIWSRYIKFCGKRTVTSKVEQLAHIQNIGHFFFIGYNWNLLKKFFLPWFQFQWSNQVTILHMSQQLSCRDMCKLVTRSGQFLHIKSNMNFHRIWIMSL